jgi:hypothetical protein
MTDKTIERLASLEGNQDYTDPDVWRAILAEPDPEPAAQPQATQGETATPATEAPAAPAAEPAAATPAPPAADSSAAPAAAETKTDEAVDGVLTRDGKRVIPYDVLAEARKTSQAHAERAKQLEETQRVLQDRIAAMEAGKKDEQPAPEVFSKDRIDAVREDMPEMAELMESQNRLARELAEAKSAAAAVPAPQPDPDLKANIQAAIDDRPLLAKWQAKGGIAWQRAVELDKGLRSDPAWASKSIAEQFAHVERLVADELGVDVPAQAAAPAPAPIPAPTAAPKPNAPTVPVAEAPHPTVSDFNGSAPVTADPLAGLAVGAQVDKAMSMSVEDIYRMAGIQH